jgi:hypothetical protein
LGFPSLLESRMLFRPPSAPDFFRGSPAAGAPNARSSRSGQHGLAGCSIAKHLNPTFDPHLGRDCLLRFSPGKYMAPGTFHVVEQLVRPSGAPKADVHVRRHGSHRMPPTLRPSSRSIMRWHFCFRRRQPTTDALLHLCTRPVWLPVRRLCPSPFPPSHP